MPLGRIITLTVLLGPIYVLAVFGGFKLAPAAHGGIFMNGVLPLITLVITWTWLSQRPSKQEIFGSLIILCGVILTVGDTSFSFLNTWQGDLMLVTAALFFCLYMVVSRLWSVTSLQVLMCSSVLNAIIFVPIWYLFLPSGIAEATPTEFWLQALFQGLVPNLFGLLMITLAARHIGPSNTAAYMASVPGLVALLSLIFLNEPIGLISWAGIFVLTIGILAMTLNKRHQD